ncbi:MAG: hypothetical protein CMO01_12630 [Thalassobius sp.]|nr:hypothetical protein [Thalassovita sp.]
MKLVHAVVVILLISCKQEPKEVKIDNIKHSFFESAKWVSDAMVFIEINNDTTPYNLSEGKRAFGIRVRYCGMSTAKSYENENVLILPEEQTSSWSEIL